MNSQLNLAVRVCIAIFTLMGLAAGNAVAAKSNKPNILFIMGDDIGIMNVGAYHQGLMVGETPNIDRLANEGARFMTYYAEQSCTAGRTAFFTGMHPLRAGMVMPQLPGATSSLLPGTPALAKFLLDLGYNTGEFGKNHLGDKSASLPTAHGFQEFWGYLYHLDAMQGISFPTWMEHPTEQAVVPPCMNTPVKGLKEPAGAVDPMKALCMTPPRPVLPFTSSGTEKNQSCKDMGPLTLERSRPWTRKSPPRSSTSSTATTPRKPASRSSSGITRRACMSPPCSRTSTSDTLGDKGGKDWGIHEAGMKQMDDNIGYVFKKLEEMGEMDNTIIVFTTDNGAEAITYPDGGITPFRGGKLTTWEGGMRAPMLIRWPGHVKAGTNPDQIFSSLDWVPTLVNIAGGPTGDGLKKQIEAGKYPGIVKTTLDGFDQRDYLEGKADSARDTFFYYTGAQPSAVRYKNWKFYYTMVSSDAEGFFHGRKNLSLDHGQQPQA